jgi:hypothetical protein
MKIPNTIQEVNMWKLNTTSLEKKLDKQIQLNLYQKTNLANV